MYIYCLRCWFIDVCGAGATGYRGKVYELHNSTLSIVILQEAILECEFRLLALAPSRLVVKVDVRALLVVVGDLLGLFVPLEPRQVLLMVAPALFLQLLRSQVLLVRALLIVKNEE